MTQTIEYYNLHAADFTESTLHADMSKLYAAFLKHIKAGAKILDMGCGSGRDSKFFIEYGFTVKAIDASAELCKIATERIGQLVECISFSDMSYENEFDGVWACASLLHVPFGDLPGIFGRIAKALKENGCAYVSFKYGDFSGYRNGRFFTDMTEKTLENILHEAEGLKIADIFKTRDVRAGRENELWLNAILLTSAN
ncbi:SAM-dependent methyltransferase [Synergistales bacterium]|nr:SAM-dependent methyltransferase [Synergistales bacterium]